MPFEYSAFLGSYFADPGCRTAVALHFNEDCRPLRASRTSNDRCPTQWTFYSIGAPLKPTDPVYAGLPDGHCSLIYPEVPDFYTFYFLGNEIPPESFVEAEEQVQ